MAKKSLTDVEIIQKQISEVEQLKATTIEFAKGLDISKKALQKMLKNPLMKELIKQPTKKSFVARASRLYP